MVSHDPWWLFWRNAMPQYGVTLAQYFVPLLTLPYLTRVLGAEVYGQVVLLTAFSSYFQLLVEFGFNQSSATSIARHGGDKEGISLERNAVVRSRVLLSLLSSPLFAFLIWFTGLADGFRSLALAYFASALLNAFIPIYLFRGLERMPSLSMFLVFSRLVFAALIFLLVRSAEDVLWVPVSNAVGSLLVIGYSFWFIRSKLALPNVHSDCARTAGTLRSSFPYFIDAVSSTAFGALTVLFIATVGLPLAEIAVWGAAYQIIAAAQSMYGPIMASLLPRMARSLDWRLVRRLLALLLPLVLLGSAGVFLAADLVMTVLYGHEFANGGSVLRALVPVLVLSFPALMLGAPLLGTIGKQGAIASSTMVSGALYLASLGVLWALGAVTLERIALLRGAAELVLLCLRSWRLRSYLS